MRILRCELCEKPCTLIMLDNKPVAFCPKSGEKVHWELVNKKWTEAPHVRQADKEDKEILATV